MKLFWNILLCVAFGVAVGALHDLVLKPLLF
jgi:hypothetical protein